MMRNRSSIIFVSWGNGQTANATEIPSTATIVMTAVAVTRPEMTAFAERHISFSPSFTSFCLKIGMNAAVSAPSPSKRRKRLGTEKANWNALATQSTPMNDAYAISRATPNKRLVIVAPAMAPEDFNICDTRPESRVLAGVKEARRVGKCFIGHFFPSTCPSHLDGRGRYRTQVRVLVQKTFMVLQRGLDMNSNGSSDTFANSNMTEKLIQL